MKKSITELLGHSLIRVNVSELTHDQKQLLQEKLFSFGCYWGNPAHTNIINLDATWYYIGIDKKEGKLGWDTVHCPSSGNYIYHAAKELTYNQLMEKLNMTFTKADLKTGMIIEFMDGQIAQVLLGTSNGDIVTGDDWFPLKDRTDEDLFKLSVSSSIKMVYQSKSNKFFSLVEAKRDGLSKYEYNIVWKRPEPISAQQQAILDLEAKQQELIDQAEKIKADIAKLKGM